MPAAASPTPDGKPAPTTQKRKRSIGDIEPQTNGISTDHSTSPDSLEPTPELEKLQEQLLDILQRHDTIPSILDYPIKESEPSTEPSAKRAKISQDTHRSTIANLLAHGGYASVEALSKDVEKVSAEILAPIKAKEQTLVIAPYGRHGELTGEETQLLASVLAFQKVLKDIIEQEPDATAKTKLSNGVTTPGSVDDTSIDDVTVKPEPEEKNILDTGRTVLSIFASAQGAKQLFSGFQNPITVNNCRDGTNQDFDASVDITLPLRESGLPNFIVTTKVPNKPVDNSKPKTQSFGERFGPPRTVPPLQTPKPSNKLTTKGSVVTWISAETLSRTTPRHHYNWCGAKLSVGQWLGYGGADAVQEPFSPEEKRRQRDRALSSGAAQPIQSDATRIAMQQAKDDALFRSVFSSFAPTHDNLGAVVPEETKSEIWWNKIGRERAERVFIDPLLLGEDSDEEKHGKSALEDEEEMFKKAVEEFDPADFDIDIENVKSEENTEVDDMLQEINDLIETLYSYQRIRLSTLPTNPMTPGQRNPLTDLIGTPSTPSAAEKEVYNTLQAQLAQLILLLPPYAVARLNGDKLEALNVSGHILVETNDEPGTMDDDTPAVIPKQPVVNHAATPQQLPARAPSASYTGYPASGGGYNRPAVQPQAGIRSSSSYFPQQGGPPRTPSSVSYRPSSGVQTFAGGYPSTVPRPGYPQQGYNQSTPVRATGYTQPPQLYQQVQQQMAAGKTNYSSYYSGTPQTQSRTYSQTPGSNYPQRPQANPSYAGYQQPVQSPHMRTASPMQQSMHPQTAAGSPPQYNRTPSAGQRSQYYGMPAQAAAIGPSGFHSTMTTQEQQQMMERQRAQIAVQTQARLAAAGHGVSGMTPSRQSSGTPQPAANGSQQFGAQTNGTPVTAHST